MFRSFSSRIAFALVLQLFVLVGVFVASRSLLVQQESDGLVVNLSGRQRMLVERTSQEALVYQRLSKRPDATPRELQAAAEDLLNSIKVFDATLTALKTGGNAPVDIAMTELRPVPPPATSEISAQFETVTRLWVPYQDALRRVTAAGANVDEADIDAVLGLNPQILQEMNTAVSLEQAQADGRVMKMLQVQFAALLLSALATAGALALTHRMMTVPLRDLVTAAYEMASGNLDRPIDTTTSLTEVSSLVRSIDQLRQNLKKTIDDLRRSDEMAALAEENARLARQAEEASRSKSQFLATMSHELRTPLNGIIGFAELSQKVNGRVQNKLAPQDSNRQALAEQGNFLQQIQGSAVQLLGLINQVLDLSKVEAGRMDVFIEEVSIEQMVNGVAEACRPLVAENGNTLELNIERDIGLVHTDATKLRQCLTNLVSNAAKFTKGGTVRMSAQSELRHEDEWIVLKVADTGIGMSKEDLAKIFKPFTQVDASITRQYGGTGMGLAIVKEMVTLLEGRVDAESERYKGTTFTIQIPRRHGNASKPSKSDASKGVASAPTGAVLRVN